MSLKLHRAGKVVECDKSVLKSFNITRGIGSQVGGGHFNTKQQQLEALGCSSKHKIRHDRKATNNFSSN